MIGHVSMQIHTNGLVDRSFYINFILVKYPVKISRKKAKLPLTATTYEYMIAKVCVIAISSS